MPGILKLVGLDFGTTTSSAVVATARLAKNSVTGRMDLSELRESFRSEMLFTPLRDGKLDLQAIEGYLDAWLSAGNVRDDEVFGGGALLTGLAAQSENAAALVSLIRQRLGDALIATADDPCLESWLAFMGNCAELSRAYPEQAILNLDIGGGTTNLAWGKAGEVLRTGCLYVGARHVQVAPGSYRIVNVSRYARALLDHLDIRKGPSDCLNEPEIEAILDFYVMLLQAATSGDAAAFQKPVARLHEQVAFHGPRDVKDVVLTFSGGVGQLVYSHLQGKPWPPTTHYGDLGIDLAQRIVSELSFAQHLKKWRPTSGGRATAFGLLRHSTEVSGSTLFLPDPAVLPLADIPILGSLSADSTAEHFRHVLDLARRSPRGGCVQVHVGGQDAEAVAAMGKKIASAIGGLAFPQPHPLVLLVRENVGKVLGHYVTQWGSLPLNLVVIDEIVPRDAQYVRIGSPRSQVVPVSFYGLNKEESHGA